jgi:hypothetical protein
MITKYLKTSLFYFLKALILINASAVYQIISLKEQPAVTLVLPENMEIQNLMLVKIVILLALLALILPTLVLNVNLEWV